MQLFASTMPLFLVTDAEDGDTRVMTLTELETYARVAEMHGETIGAVHYVARGVIGGDVIGSDVMVTALPVALESRVSPYDDADYAYVSVDLMTEHGRVGVIGWTVDGRA